MGTRREHGVFCYSLGRSIVFLKFALGLWFGNFFCGAGSDVNTRDVNPRGGLERLWGCTMLGRRLLRRSLW